MDNAVVLKNEALSKQRPETPYALLEMAISQNADLDKLERIMALQERHEAKEARKAYTAAMAGFRGQAPKLIKNAEVDFTSAKGRTNYKHETLDHVVNVITPILSNHGLSHTWSVTQQDGHISVTCKMTHISGHSEEVTLSASPDSTGNKNSIQAIGSTVSYLERYTLKAICGLAAGQDDDGNGAGNIVDTITEEQAINLLEICESKGYTKAKLQALAEKIYRLKRIDDLPSDKFKEAQIKLNKLPNSDVKGD